MFKSLSLFLSALGAVALLLGLTYGLSTRSYRDAEIAALQARVARSAEVGAALDKANAALDEARAALDAQSSRADELASRVEELEVAMAAQGQAVATVAAAEMDEPAAEPTEGAAAVFGDAAKGAEVFGKCKGCHMIGPGARHRIGPHLNEIFGRPAASLEDFRYSKAFLRVGRDGLEWHADTLSAFIENPRQIATGTRMSFPGLDDPQEVADLVAYLRDYSAQPQDIPESDPTASPTDHSVDPAILAIVGDPEYGEYLSSECTGCHQASGGDDGIPSIVLWPKEDFVTAMHAYKDKVRPHPVMQMLAGRLSAEEIAALAAYFGNLED